MFTSARPAVNRLRPHHRTGAGARELRRAVNKQSSQRRRSDQEQDWRARGRCSCSRSASPRAAAAPNRRAARAPSSSGSGTISGAGSTFAAPVYEQWASAQSGLTVNYQAVGSGAGITALETKTVDFGASDPPLKPEDEEAIAKNGSPAVQIPMFLGAITVSYNLPGVKTGLKLDGKTIADIFLGKIKTWNDPEIKALNPGVHAARARRSRSIHRSDSSGTTSGFTSFLAAVDPEFKSKVGEGKDVQWPTGTGAKGNAGVAGAVAADGGRRRLRRAGLRAAAQLHLRVGQEQGRRTSSRRRWPRPAPPAKA